MAKSIVVTILLLPLAEIAAFILVAALLGLGPAFLLMLASTLAGFLMLRRAGRDSLARLRVAMSDTNVSDTDSSAAGIEAHTGGLLTVLAGLLLFLPGFLTDLVGLALLIGPVRLWCGGAVRRWLRHRHPTDRSTVDLAPGEWVQMPDRELSNHSDRRRD
jgi:UPF0716 protein FxsA